MMPPESKLVRIEKPVYGGAFLARLDGKAVFTPLTLPGEEARIRIVEDKRGYATAEAEEIVQAAPRTDCARLPDTSAHAVVATINMLTTKRRSNLSREILRETLERAGRSRVCRG